MKLKTIRNKLFFIFIYLMVLFSVLLLMRFSLRLSVTLFLILPLALIDNQPKKFILYWMPLGLIIILYDLLRGIADNLGGRVDLLTLPKIEETLFFGTLPSVLLQSQLDIVLYTFIAPILLIIYFGHFIVPPVVLYMLWKKNIHLFKIASISLVLLSFSAMTVFLLFPAAPPWMASELGAIPKINRFILFYLKQLDVILGSFNIPSYYLNLSANPVAPFPSLHAGYALLVYLWTRSYFSGYLIHLLAGVYFLLSAFAIVLFGEHYVIDVLGGWVFAGMAFWVSRFMKEKRT